MKTFGITIIAILFGIFAIVGCHFTYQCGYNLGRSMGDSPLVVINEDLRPVIVEETVDTLAIKNKNPLNIKVSLTDPWKGQIGVDEHKHVIFSSWEHGIRAASFVLKNYTKKHKISTIEGIVNRFARGNTKPYVNYLCKNMGLAKDEKFDVIARLSELLKHMSRFESGQELPDELFIPYEILAYL